MTLRITLCTNICTSLRCDRSFQLDGLCVYTMCQSFTSIYLLDWILQVLYQIARVAEVLKTHKVLLDRSRTDESVENADTSSLVVGSTRPCPTERLLTNHSPGGFFVVINVSSSVA